MILIYSNPESRRIWQGFSDGERAVGLEAYAALHQELTGSGELIASEALADPARARRVALPSDGPFAEAKEHLAGFFLVDCDGFDRALEIAGRVPEAPLGLVEVREVVDPSQAGT